MSQDLKYTPRFVILSIEGSFKEKAFVGRLPKAGEPVDLVCMGETADGVLEFQLKVREEK
jgi:hypothetical protein